MTTRNDIERVLWKACDSFRGKIDSSRYKDYIILLCFNAIETFISGHGQIKVMR